VSDRRCRVRKERPSRTRRCVPTEMRTGHNKRSALGQDRSDDLAEYAAKLRPGLSTSM
jgi:hypothetical protein